MSYYQMRQKGDIGFLQWECGLVTAAQLLFHMCRNGTSDTSSRTSSTGTTVTLSITQMKTKQLLQSHATSTNVEAATNIY
jgi:hypothetical protein